VIRPVGPKRQQITGDCKIQRDDTVYTLQSAQNGNEIRENGWARSTHSRHDKFDTFCRKTWQEAVPW